MKSVIAVSKVQYAEFFRLLFDRYASSAKIEIDCESFGPGDIERLKSTWCTRRKIRDAREFSLRDGQREVASFHDSVDELSISLEEIEWLRELSKKGVLRFRVLPVIESSSFLSRIPATRVRRFLAGLLNLMSAGFSVMLTGALVAHSVDPARYGVAGRLWAIGLLAALWLLCVLKKKSLGAMVCLLEIRRRDGEQPSFSQMATRSLPVLFLAVSGVFPAELLPAWLDTVRMVLFLVAVLVVFASALFGFFGGSSLLDRWSRTVVLQLNLPEHAKPRVFGMRIV